MRLKVSCFFSIISGLKDQGSRFDIPNLLEPSHRSRLRSTNSLYLHTQIHFSNSSSPCHNSITTAKMPHPKASTTITAQHRRRRLKEVSPNTNQPTQSPRIIRLYDSEGTLPWLAMQQEICSRAAGVPKTWQHLEGGRVSAREGALGRKAACTRCSIWGPRPRTALAACQNYANELSSEMCSMFEHGGRVV